MTSTGRVFEDKFELPDGPVGPIDKPTAYVYNDIFELPNAGAGGNADTYIYNDVFELPSVGSAPLIQDTFNRANASVLGNADTGQPWTAANGTIGIRSNKAAWISSAADARPYAYVDDSYDTDINVDFTLSATPDRRNCGVIFRRTGPDDYLFVKLEDTAGEQTLALMRRTTATSPAADQTIQTMAFDYGGSNATAGIKLSIGGGAPNPLHLAAFESALGQSCDALRFYVGGGNVPWSDNAWSGVKAAYARGQEIMVSKKPVTNWASVIAGNEDAYFTGIANGIRSLGTATPIIFFFHHEMENDGAPDTVAADFVAAFRRVVNVMRPLVGNNVRFGCCYIDGVSFKNGGTISSWYPGDAYVDYLGVDPYDWKKPIVNGYGTKTGDAALSSFVTVGNFAQTHHKPWGMMEFGASRLVSDTGGALRAAWIGNTFAPFIRTFAYQPEHISYFDLDAGEAGAVVNWRIDQEAASMAAFKSIQTSTSIAPPTHNLHINVTGNLVQIYIDGALQMTQVLGSPDLARYTGRGSGLLWRIATAEDDGATKFDNWNSGLATTPDTLASTFIFQDLFELPPAPDPDPDPPPPLGPNPIYKWHSISYASLTPYERHKLEDALVNSHRIEVEINQLDQDEHYVRSLTSPAQRVTEGQIDVDTTQDVHRQMQAVVYDPSHKLDFSQNGHWAFWYDTFIEVRQRVLVTSLKAWVVIPIFMGPLSHFERTADMVTLEALGKEALALEPMTVWKARKFRKGEKVVDVIEAIMRGQGERRFDFPKKSARLHTRLSVARGDEAWKVCQKLAEGIDKMLYYNGRGVLCLRSHPGHSSWTFQYGVNITTMPTATYDALTQFHNAVILTGSTASAGSKKIVAVALPPSAHPLSPQSLSRHGEPRYLVEKVDNSQIKKQDDANKQAHRRLDHDLAVVLAGEFEALSIPHLDEHDLVHIKAPGVSLQVPMQTWSIPLVGGTMTVGANRSHHLKRRKVKGKWTWL